jgi:hypothetical protein
MNLLLDKTVVALNVLSLSNGLSLQQCTSPLLPLNISGISLSAGGLFDACWNGGSSCKNGATPFAPPHRSHRVGNDADLPVKGLSDACKLTLETALHSATNFNVNIFPVMAESPDDIGASHWHVRIPYVSDPLVTTTQPMIALRREKAARAAAQSTTSVVSAQAAFAGATERFKYFYSVSNGVSQQPLDGLSIQFDTPAFLPTNPNGWISTVLGSPQGWYWGAIASGSETTDAIPLSIAAIGFGSTVEGFSFENPLPPTIRTFSVHPFSPVPLLDSEDEIEQLPPPAQPITGSTIGPRSTIPSPTAYVDDIAALKDQAFNAGWIDNSGIVNSLDQKLQAVIDALNRGNSKEAANTLTAFMREVEAQQGKHLTGEAYALLFFNAQYLRDHL